MFLNYKRFKIHISIHYTSIHIVLKYICVTDVHFDQIQSDFQLNVSIKYVISCAYDNYNNQPISNAVTKGIEQYPYDRSVLTSKRVIIPHGY